VGKLKLVVTIISVSYTSSLADRIKTGQVAYTDETAPDTEDEMKLLKTKLVVIDCYSSANIRYDVGRVDYVTVC
jgi:hypothetical protein